MLHYVCFATIFEKKKKKFSELKSFVFFFENSLLHLFLSLFLCHVVSRRGMMPPVAHRAIEV